MQYEAIAPMEPAHLPRPFGCGLRVTVNGVPTRTSSLRWSQPPRAILKPQVTNLGRSRPDLSTSLESVR